LPCAQDICIQLQVPSEVQVAVILVDDSCVHGYTQVVLAGAHVVPSLGAMGVQLGEGLEAGGSQNQSDMLRTLFARHWQSLPSE